VHCTLQPKKGKNGKYRSPTEVLSRLRFFPGEGETRLCHTFGPASETLSGGEAQRVKLVKETGKLKRGHRRYILDEPTTGLHLADIKHLLDCLKYLVDSGHRLIVIEHNM
jgi:ABC-type hemin transport system ATPase subunit